MTWTQKEDSQLRKLVEQAQEGRLPWKMIAQKLRALTNVQRTEKQCRDRYHNQLKTGLNLKANWSRQEQSVLFQINLYEGNKWSKIVSQLPGRSQDAIKNYFYQSMKKALRKVNLYIKNNKAVFKRKNGISENVLRKVLKDCGDVSEELVIQNVSPPFPQKSWEIKKQLIQIVASENEVNDKVLRKISLSLIDFSKSYSKPELQERHNPLSPQLFIQEEGSPRLSHSSVQSNEQPKTIGMKSKEEEKKKINEQREIENFWLEDRVSWLDERVSTNGFDDKRTMSYVPIDMEDKDFCLDLGLGPRFIFKGYYEDSNEQRADMQ